MTESKNPKDIKKFDEWNPQPTDLDPFGPLRGGLAESLKRLNKTDGALLVKAAMAAITHVVVVAERLMHLHGLVTSRAIPDRNFREPAKKVDKKKKEKGYLPSKPSVGKIRGQD